MQLIYFKEKAAQALGFRLEVKILKHDYMKEAEIYSCFGVSLSRCLW